jgi:trigger factor
LQSTLEIIEKNKAKIKLTISGEAYEQAVAKAYQQSKGRFSVPGFRKGKAPRKVIETHYGESVFFEDALDLAFPEAYDAAIDEHGLFPVSRPEVEIDGIGDDKSVTLSAVVYTKPVVELEKYKGIEAKDVEHTVSDEDVQAEVDKAMEKNSRYVEAGRPAENGDRVILDYSGSVDSVKFAGGTAENQTLELGSGRFIPGFEEQVVGMNAGEEKVISVKFPEEYHSEELKGKDAEFEIKLHEVKMKELPAFDDEFVKDTSEFDTTEEYLGDIKDKLTKAAEARTAAEKRDNAVEALVDSCEFDIPEVMFRNQAVQMVRELEYNMRYQGMSLEDYMKYTGTTPESLLENYMPQAKRSVKTQLVIEAVEKAEALEADEKDVDAKIAEMAEAAGKSAEEYAKLISEDDREYIKRELIWNKAIDVIADNAVFVKEEKKAAEKKKKAPAKKAAAKEADKEEQEEEKKD